MSIQDELKEIAEKGEMLTGQDISPTVHKFSSDDRIEQACEVVYDKVIVDVLRRTTLIISDLVAFYFKLYLMVGEFVKENTWAKDHVGEVADLVNRKAGEDPTLVYDTILQQVEEELSAKYKGEGK